MYCKILHSWKWLTVKYSVFLIQLNYYIQLILDMNWTFVICYWNSCFQLATLVTSKVMSTTQGIVCQSKKAVFVPVSSGVMKYFAYCNFIFLYRRRGYWLQFHWEWTPFFLPLNTGLFLRVNISEVFRTFFWQTYNDFINVNLPKTLRHKIISYKPLLT